MKNHARLTYDCCDARNHLNPMILYDYGFLEFVEGNSDKYAEIAEKYLHACKKLNIDHQSNPNQLMLLGQSYIETAQYDKAIDILSDLIQKDPENKEAYFHRASAYFETGNFDEALADFLNSDSDKKVVKSASSASKEFLHALIDSLQKSASESMVEFVPSLCNSAYGLSKTLWAFHWSINPVNPEAISNVHDFANASYEMGTCMMNYCKNIDAETIDGYVDQVKDFYHQFDQMNDAQKGELMGSIIGKYSVDIFAGAAAGTVAGKGMQYTNKMVSLSRSLRNANRVCNFEAMLLSEAEKKAIVSSSLAHAAEKENYFKNVKIHWDRQNKHVSSAHNFQARKGTISIEKSELEVLLKAKAGKGERVTGHVLEAGYKERIDFGKIIGEYAIESKGKPTKYIPTTKGIVHYDKKGHIHVIPSDPYAIIE